MTAKNNANKPTGARNVSAGRNAPRSHGANCMVAVNSTPAQPILLRLPDVERMTGIKRSMIYRLEGEGRFPRKVKIGEHASAWVASEVAEWVAARISARDAA